MVALGFCVQRLRGWLNTGVFVQTAMPAASVCDRVCIRAFCVHMYSMWMCAHLGVKAWLSVGKLLCLQVHVCLTEYTGCLCACGGLHVEGYTAACVCSGKDWASCDAIYVYERCGHQSHRVTTPVTTRSRTLLANMGWNCMAGLTGFWVKVWEKLQIIFHAHKIIIYHLTW